MDAILFLTKFLIFNLIGYYILNIIFKEKSMFQGMISPSYGVFGILMVYFQSFRLPIVFLAGVLVIFMLNQVGGLFDEKLMTRVNYKIFGILAIIQVLIINPILDVVLNSSSASSISFLCVVLGTFFVLDVTYTLRKLM